MLPDGVTAGDWGSRVSLVSLLQDQRNYDEAIEVCRGGVARWRPDRPLPVGRALAANGTHGFLSGPEASWISGTCIAVDGGHHLQRAPRVTEWVRQDQGPEWLPE